MNDELSGPYRPPESARGKQGARIRTFSYLITTAFLFLGGMSCAVLVLFNPIGAAFARQVEIVNELDEPVLVSALSRIYEGRSISYRPLPTVMPYHPLQLPKTTIERKRLEPGAKHAFFFDWDDWALTEFLVEGIGDGTERWFKIVRVQNDEDPCQCPPDEPVYSIHHETLAPAPELLLVQLGYSVATK